MPDDRIDRLSFYVSTMNRNSGVDERRSRFVINSGDEDRRMDSFEYKFQSSIYVPAFIAWGLLFLSVFLSAMVPCWLMGDVKAYSLTRNSWRCFIVTVLLLPFVLFYYRKQKEKRYRLLDKLDLYLIKKIYLCSVNECLCVLVMIYACKLTSMTHTFGLIQLRYFAGSIIKFHRSKPYHYFEIAGTFLVCVGIFCMFYDSLTMPVIPELTNQRYLSYKPFQRCMGDIIALIAAFVMFSLSEKCTLPTYPLYTNMFLFYLFMTFNFINFGFFFGGSEFSFHPKFGVMGLFTRDNFVSIFYVSIILGLSLMILLTLVNYMFSYLIRNISSCFYTLTTTVLYQMLNLEITHIGYTAMAFGFMVPGMLLIVAGQNILTGKEFSVDYMVYKPESRNNSKIEQKQKIVYMPEIIYLDYSPSTHIDAKRVNIKTLRIDSDD